MIIVGCSGLGREVAWLCKRNNLFVKGFLDDNPDLLGYVAEGIEVIGPVSAAVNFLEEHFLIAIANPRVRKDIYLKLVNIGVKKFPALVDHAANVGHSSSIGEGVIVFPGAIVTVNCKLGKFTIINKNCSVGHDAVISDFCTLAPLAMTGGHVQLSESVEIGASSCIRQGLRIGEYTKVGMGSTVVKDIGPDSIVVGNPAKPLKR